MNVFVLCTGRCGSTTFIRSCAQATNYTSGHETRSGLLGAERLAYPPDHIEADNRLSWFLGRLDAAYGDRAAYVHLERDPEATAQSFARRYRTGIMGAYQGAVLMGLAPEVDELAVCRDYVVTVTANIRAFLRDKTRVCQVRLERIADDFRRFWSWVGAQGDLDAALAEWTIRHNASW